MLLAVVGYGCLWLVVVCCGWLSLLTNYCCRLLWLVDICCGWVSIVVGCGWLSFDVVGYRLLSFVVVCCYW